MASVDLWSMNNILEHTCVYFQADLNIVCNAHARVQLLHAGSDLDQLTST